MKKLLSGILIFPFFLSAHTTFALSDTLQARKDVTNITREGNRIIQETTKSVKKLSDTSVKKIYLDQLDHKKSELLNIASNLKWDTKDTRAKRITFVRNSYLPNLKNFQKEIETNSLSSIISTEEKNTVETNILAYQKELLLPIQEFLESYGSGDIKSTGNSSFEYKGTLGRAKVSFDAITSLQSLVSNNLDVDTTIQTSLDLLIPPETSCSYNGHDEYVCMPKTATGRLALDATLELSLSIRENEVLITPKRFSYIPVALPSTGKYASLSGSLAQTRTLILSSLGQTTYSFPIDSTVRQAIISTDSGKQLRIAKDILTLFTTKSLFTPLAKNTNGYLLGNNEALYEALGKILDQKMSKVMLPYPPIWYANGSIWSSWIESYGMVGNMRLSRENGLPKFELHFDETISGEWKGDYVQTGKNFVSHLMYQDFSGKASTLDASLEKDMFHATLSMPDLETFYKNTFTYPLPTTPITLDIRGSFSLKNSNLYASLGGHDFAQLKWYYSSTISNFYGWINTYGQDFKLSSDSNQTRGTFTYKDYGNITKTNGTVLEKLFETSKK